MNTRTMSAPAPISPPADVDMAIRVRAARACFTSAVGAAMLANVAAGISPRWWKGAPRESMERWGAFDHLSGLLAFASIAVGDGATGELRTILGEAQPHVPTSVIIAGTTLADTIDAEQRVIALRAGG